MGKGWAAHLGAQHTAQPHCVRLPILLLLGWESLPAWTSFSPYVKEGTGWKAHNVSPGGKSGGPIHCEGHLV